jgi:hypothetical protein
LKFYCEVAQEKSNRDDFGCVYVLGGSFKKTKWMKILWSDPGYLRIIAESYRWNYTVERIIKISRIN